MRPTDGCAALVCDLDGVVYRGAHPVPHAVEVLAHLDLPVIYSTNNASRPPQLVAAHLRELGLPADAARVVTSSMAGAHAIAVRLPPAARVLAVGGPGVDEALRAEGLSVVSPGEPGAVKGVLQGYGADVTATDLAEAAYAVQSGAVWVATNTDRTLPTDRGTAPGNGTLVAAVGAACARQPDLVAGKPHAPLYRLCAELTGLGIRDLLAVGDRLDTDIAGAAAVGMASALVLTGVDDLTSLAMAPAGMRPTYLLADLRGLEHDYAAPTENDRWWTCGGDRRRLVDGCWRVATQGAAVDSARAAVAAVQAARDAGLLAAEDVPPLMSQLPRWQ